MSRPITIDCRYTDRDHYAASYLLTEGDEAAFVEVNTALALPKLLAALAAAGLGPEQVRHVFVTHVHLDHAGGASAIMDACPQATLWCHPRAARHLVDPARLVASATAVYGDERFRQLYGRIAPIDEARVRTLDDGETVVWGRRTLTALHTRGHANHHLVLHDSASNGVFTGDSFGIRYPALQDAGRLVFPSTSPTDFDAAAALYSVDRVVDTGCSEVYPTHFGAWSDIPEMAAALRSELVGYGQLVLEALSLRLEGEALQRWCAHRIDARFEALLARRVDRDLAWELCALDRTLNAQGVAVAVARARR